MWDNAIQWKQGRSCNLKVEYQCLLSAMEIAIPVCFCFIFFCSMIYTVLFLWIYTKLIRIIIFLLVVVYKISYTGKDRNVLLQRHHSDLTMLHMSPPV